MKGFDAFFESVKQKEGLAWNRDATEGEGGSYCGVTRESFNEFVQYDTVTHNNYPDFAHSDFSKNAERDNEVLYEFYKWYILTRYKLDCIPDWLIYAVADWSIQSGAHAIKPLQERAGLTGRDVDGLIGSGTLKALEEMFSGVEGELADDPDADADFVNWYCDKRKEFMTNWLNKSGNMEKLGKGIYARLKKVRNLTLLQCESDDDDIVDIPKKIDDTESAEISGDKASLMYQLEGVIGALQGLLDTLRHKTDTK